MLLSRLHIEKDWFVDEYGRRVLLRGVNFTVARTLSKYQEKNSKQLALFRVITVRCGLPC